MSKLTKIFLCGVRRTHQKKISVNICKYPQRYSLWVLHNSTKNFFVEFRQISQRNYLWGFAKTDKEVLCGNLQIPTKKFLVRFCRIPQRVSLWRQQTKQCSRLTRVYYSNDLRLAASGHSDQGRRNRRGLANR